MKFDFEKELLYAKRKLKKNPNQEKYLFEAIESILNYTIQMEKTGIKHSKIMEELFKKIINYIERYVKLAGFYSLQKQYNVLQLYANNEHLIARDYKNIDSINLTEDEITSKANKLKKEDEWNKFILQLTLRDLKIEKKELGTITGINKIVQMNKKDREKILKILNPKEKQLVLKYIKISSGTELEQLKEYIKYREKDCEIELKYRYIEILKLAGSFFKKFDLLKKDLEIYKQRFKELSMPEMAYPLTKQEKEAEDIALEEIFEQETLEQFNLEELALLNIFWQNRFIKRIKDISNAIFAMRTLSREDKNIDFSEKTIENVILKKLICDNLFLKVARNLKSGEEYKMRDLTKEDKEFINQYEKYFNNEIPDCNNEFMQDINVTNIYGNLEFNAYNAKISITSYFIQNVLTNNTKVTNWGVIPEDKQENKNYIIIGIDYPGFNMPVKVHILKKEIKQYIYNLQGDMILPIYKGDKDMVYKGRDIKTNILMPLTKKRQEYIIDKVASLNPVDLKYLLIKHLGNLVTIKNKKTTKIYPEKYIDLQTGKTGIKINRNFIADENETETKNDKEISQK